MKRLNETLYLDDSEFSGKEGSLVIGTVYEFGEDLDEDVRDMIQIVVEPIERYNRRRRYRM